jgi:hypothetical protein
MPQSYSPQRCPAPDAPGGFQLTVPCSRSAPTGSAKLLSMSFWSCTAVEILGASGSVYPHPYFRISRSVLRFQADDQQWAVVPRSVQPNSSKADLPAAHAVMSLPTADFPPWSKCLACYTAELRSVVLQHCTGGLLMQRGRERCLDNLVTAEPKPLGMGLHLLRCKCLRLDATSQDTYIVSLSQSNACFSPCQQNHSFCNSRPSMCEITQFNVMQHDFVQARICICGNTSQLDTW